MSSRRYLGLRLARQESVLTVVAPGCPEAWPSTEPLAGDWVGVPAAGGRGMSVEDDTGTVRVVLEEQTGYTVRVTGATPSHAGFGAATIAALTGRGASETVFRLDTGNLVALTTIAFGGLAEDDPTIDVPVRIRVRKLGDPDSDFAWLVGSIVNTIRALALTVASPTTLKIDRRLPGTSYAYEDLVFLRAIATDVERTVARISRNPHRRIVERVEVADAWLAPEVAPGQLAMIMSDPRALARVSEAAQRRLVSPSARARLTRPDRRLAPVRVPAIRREVSYDTYENRFVRFAVTAFRRRALAIADAATRAGSDGLSREARVLAARFGAILRIEPFDDVGDLSSFTSTSQVLLREESYNGLLRLYREFVLTSDVVWDQFRMLHENRDVAALYEIWVYLETVRSVAAIVARPAEADHSALALIRTLPDGLHVNLAAGTASAVTFLTPSGRVRVTYNQSYGRAGVDPRPSGVGASYSLPLRPDVSLLVEGQRSKRRVFLDAKYRVDGLGDVFARLEDADDGVPEPQGTFKIADVYKMHTYRDAIGGAHAAVAVYPGTERRLYPADPQAFVDGGGVGAIPLRPRDGYDRGTFEAEVRSLLDRAWASMGST